MKPIVVVGSINMDLVCQTERIPRPGQTVMGTSFAMNPGGKGANQAVAVARLGHPSILLGSVGEDSFGRELLEALSDYGVETSYIRRVEGASGIASIVVDVAGENMILVVPGANLQVTPEYLHSRRYVLESAGMVLAQLEIPLESIEWLADYCREHDLPFMLDPAPASELSQSLLSKITWFTPNQTEATFYAGFDEGPEETARRLLALGAENILLKLGAEGAWIAMADGTQHKIDAFPAKVVDTTAAGDAFNGAFAVSLMRGGSVEASGRFASAAAAVSVTRKGAQGSLADADEVQSLLNRLQT